MEPSSSRPTSSPSSLLRLISCRRRSGLFWNPLGGKISILRNSKRPGPHSRPRALDRTKRRGLALEKGPKHAADGRPPLLLLPGTACDRRIFQPLIDRLEIIPLLWATRRVAGQCRILPEACLRPRHPCSCSLDFRSEASARSRWSRRCLIAWQNWPDRFHCATRPARKRGNSASGSRARENNGHGHVHPRWVGTARRSG